MGVGVEPFLMLMSLDVEGISGSEVRTCSSCPAARIREARARDQKLLLLRRPVVVNRGYSSVHWGP